VRTELGSPSVDANPVPSKKEPSGRKAKKDKVVLDTATELTSDELKVTPMLSSVRRWFVFNGYYRKREHTTWRGKQLLDVRPKERGANVRTWRWLSESCGEHPLIVS
jgi:hypothetical protein